jgi:hypothetical protein
MTPFNTRRNWTQKGAQLSRATEPVHSKHKVEHCHLTPEVTHPHTTLTRSKSFNTCLVCTGWREDMDHRDLLGTLLLQETNKRIERQ